VLQLNCTNARATAVSSGAVRIWLICTRGVSGQLRIRGSRPLYTSMRAMADSFSLASSSERLTRTALE
jgi:hypothetical protein